MTSHLTAVALVVPDYDPAIDFLCNVMGFTLTEKHDQGAKRWVTVAPPGPAQTAAIGNQAGGRVWLFLATSDFARDHARMLAAGVQFEDTPRHEPYGTVAVWRDPFGNRWDLIQPS